MTERKRPGGELASRPLHFIWILDCSGSMAGEKIQSLNTAIKEALPFIGDAAKENPQAQVLMRVLTFSSGARWHVANPTPLSDFRWADVSADAVTDMGKALTMVAEQLKVPPMENRGLPPVLVLISDGQPIHSGSVCNTNTDHHADRHADPYAHHHANAFDDADTDALYFSDAGCHV